VDGLPQANDPRKFKIHGAGAIVSELFGLFLCCEVVVCAWVGCFESADRTRGQVLHLHGPPKECKRWRRESLKGLLPYIRAVCAVGSAAHDGYSRSRLQSSDRTQGTSATPECPLPGL